jgi:hypothetical protein
MGRSSSAASAYPVGVVRNRISESIVVRLLAAPKQNCVDERRVIVGKNNEQRWMRQQDNAHCSTACMAHQLLSQHPLFCDSAASSHQATNKTTTIITRHNNRTRADVDNGKKTEFVNANERRLSPCAQSPFSAQNVAARVSRSLLGEEPGCVWRERERKRGGPRIPRLHALTFFLD